MKSTEKYPKRLNKNIHPDDTSALFHFAPIPLWKEDVTEIFRIFEDYRKKGIKDLKKHLVENPSESLHVLNAAKILDVNAKCLELYQAKSREELIGNLDKVFTEDSFSVFIKEVDALYRGETFFDSVAVNKTLKGRVMDINLKLSVYDENGRKIAVVSTEDVTEKLRTEKDLLFKNEVMEKTSVGIGISDAKGNIIFVNRGFLDMWGYREREEVLNRRPEEFWVDQEKIREIMFRSPLEGIDVHEMEARRKDGSTFPCLRAGSSIQDDQGRVIGLLASFVDISREKKAEERVRIKEEQLTALFENLQAAVIFLSPVDDMKDLVIEDVNASCTRIFRLKKEDLIGKRISEAVPDFMKKEIISEIRNTYETGRSYYAANRLYKDFRISFYMNLSVYKVSATGEVVLLVRDITQQRDREARFIHSGRLSSLSKMLGGISHEINQPLTSIKTAAQSIMNLKAKGHSVDMTEVLKKLKIIDAQTDRITKIIDQMRSMSDEDGPREMLPVDIGELMESVMNILGEQLKNQGIILTEEIAKDVPRITADRRELQQVFLNILSNAMDALEEKDKLLQGKKESFKKSLRLKITKNIVNGRDGVRVEFFDNGIGIPEENKERVFEPFFTTKDPDKGVGLGMPLSYSIIQKHNGKISFESRINQGTVFYIDLPAEQISNA